MNEEMKGRVSLDKESGLGLNIDDFYYAIMKRKRMIIIFTLLVMIFGIIYGVYFQKNRYKAKNSYFISEEVDADFNLVTSLKEIIQSESFARQVSDSMDNKVSYKTLQRDIRVTSVANRIIIITVEGNTVESVMDISKSITKVIFKIIPKYIPLSIKVIDTPSEGSVSLNNEAYVTVFTAFIAGLIIAIGFSVLLNYFQFSITKETDVGKYLDLPYLGNITKAKHV